MVTVAGTSSRRIGLIGGLALRAGVFYYEEIAKRLAEEGRSLDLLLAHADVRTVLGYVGARDRAGLGRYLGGLATSLADGGADLVAITAVAPHLAIDEVSRLATRPVVNVLECLSANIAASGWERVAVFGNRAVMDTDVFGAVPERIVVRPEPSVVDLVHETYSAIALDGKRGTEREVGLLAGIARELIRRSGAQTILLAGTDLSSFYADLAPTYPSVDVARLHVDEIVRRSLVDVAPDRGSCTDPTP